MPSAHDQAAAQEYLASAEERRSFLHNKMRHLETDRETDVEYLKWMIDADLATAQVHATLATVTR